MIKPCNAGDFYVSRQETLHEKISLRGISTPFGGLSWATTDDKEERTIKLANAKAFEAGRLLMGTYMELQFDENNYFQDKLER